MTFLHYILTPRLYKIYGEGSTQVILRKHILCVYFSLFIHFFCFLFASFSVSLNCQIFSCLQWKQGILYKKNFLLLKFCFFYFKQKFYEPGGLEKWGDQILTTVKEMKFYFVNIFVLLFCVHCAYLSIISVFSYQLIRNHLCDICL